MDNRRRKPNIVFVITDDQGYGDLGCTGNPIIKTPHIDSFYDESVRFTNFHVGPTCAPTRAGLMTGHYANSTGVWHTIGGRSLLRKDECTIASALQENGYRTGIFGKWHLGDSFPFRPQDRGFETSIVHGGGGISQTPDYWGNDYFDDTYMVNGQMQRFEGYCTDVFFREAVKFIENNREQPFFCYLATNAPHDPYNVDDRYADPYRSRVPEQRARFYGMISNIDDNFGLLREKLKELGVANDTILIFMTDNGTSGGAAFDEQGFVTEGYNAGLRGGKGSPYDGGHRVPFFLHWPEGGLNSGRDLDELAANVDFMPTLLDLCGVPVPDHRKFHGGSLKPLLDGTAAPWRDRAIVTDSQRIAHPIKWRQSSVMTRKWRLVNGKELYAAHADREQRTDLAASHPDVVQELRAEYDAWWQIVSEQFDEAIPIEIGAEEAPETEVTCHDWRNQDCSCPWNQGLIRQGMVANGYWELDVVRQGTYRFELRRWPRETDRPIRAGIEGDDIEWRSDFIHEKARGLYTGGKAVPFVRASLKIGQHQMDKDIAENDSFVEFTLLLEKGPILMQTCLSDGHHLDIGAYYVYVQYAGHLPNTHKNKPKIKLTIL